MDSLDRLSHSLEQAVALIHSLRRENRDLARQAAVAVTSAKNDVAASAEELKTGLAKAELEAQQLHEVLGEKAALEQRVSQAELESARLAEELERNGKNFEGERLEWQGHLRAAEQAARDREATLAGQVELGKAQQAEVVEQAKKSSEIEKAELEERLRSLELKLVAAEQEAAAFGQAEMEKARSREIELTAALAARELELGESRGRVAGLEALFAEKEEELETSKVAVMMLQVKIGESLSPEQILCLQEDARILEAELGELRPLKDLKAALDAEKLELRRQKKALAGIRKERELVKAKLDEIYGTLENLRLS
jgi:chromosome segregation ATPase